MPPEPKQKRLFIAISLPPELRAHVGAEQTRLQQTLPDLSWAWVLPENLHLTLRFLGFQTEAETAALSEFLVSALANRAAFELSFGRFGCFPALTSARVLFWQVEPNPAVMALQGDLETRLQQLGFAQAEHPYHPHLTLGRIRQPQSLPLHLPEPHSCPENGDPAFGGWTVDQIELFESIQGAKGVSYRSLQSFPLHKH